MQMIYADWAEALRDFSLAAINHGIQLSKAEAHPPSQGEFVAHCKQYNPEPVKLLERKFTQEEIERNKLRIREIMANLAGRKQA